MNLITRLKLCCAQCTPRARASACCTMRQGARMGPSGGGFAGVGDERAALVAAAVVRAAAEAGAPRRTIAAVAAAAVSAALTTTGAGIGDGSGPAPAATPSRAARRRRARKKAAEQKKTAEDGALGAAAAPSAGGTPASATSFRPASRASSPGSTVMAWLSDPPRAASGASEVDSMSSWPGNPTHEGNPPDRPVPAPPPELRAASPRSLVRGRDPEGQTARRDS